MNDGNVVFRVFTKPWRFSLERLGPFVKDLGFDAIELPVRPGYQVEPQAVTHALPEAARLLQASGVSINSVAGPLDAPTVAACAESGIPLIRVCIEIPPGRTYLEHEAQVQRDLDHLLPVLETYGVAIGIQNHCDCFIANAMGLRHLVERYDPRYICAVWDPAHCALNGEIPDLALDILWSHLALVNLNNVLWQRTNGPEAQVGHYKHFWTSGSQGLCSWPAVATALRQRGYGGPLCLTAEYSDVSSVDRLVRADLLFARSIFSTSEELR